MGAFRTRILGKTPRGKRLGIRKGGKGAVPPTQDPSTDLAARSAGWNSWNLAGCEINETFFRETVESLAALAAPNN